MTDIRTAALAEARGADLHHELSSAHYTRVFTAGAVWAVERVTPTREQIARRICTMKFPDAECSGELDCEESIGSHTLDIADAVLALLAGLAEGENDE